MSALTTRRPVSPTHHPAGASLDLIPISKRRPRSHATWRSRIRPIIATSNSPRLRVLPTRSVRSRLPRHDTQERV